MITSLSATQANLISSILSALDNVSSEADQMYVKVQLFDANYGDPIGEFTEEEGVWLFELPKDKLRNLMQSPAPWIPGSLVELAERIYAQNPEHYRDRKIGWIKDTRDAWEAFFGYKAGIKETKDAVESVQREMDLAALRDKLIAGDDYQYDSEERAYAEHRERMAERGTWFGVPGPLDEEPPF